MPDTEPKRSHPQDPIAETGHCPLCHRLVAGARFSADNTWLPVRGRDHDPACPYFHDPLMTSPKLSHSSLTFHESFQRQASRHVSTKVALADEPPYAPFEINLGVGATQFDDRDWPAPRFFLDTRQPLTEGQFCALADAVRQLFAAYRERFGA